MGRRNLLKAAVGLTAAGAIGVPALVFHNGSSERQENAGASPAGVQSTQPIVAFVQDAARGEVVIMSGEQQVVITDYDLVSRLAGVGRF
jgi:hypothetical protein